MARMDRMPARTQGIVASGLMAILVLSVFASSTYTGPESTIYQLHGGILTGDIEAVRQSMLQDPSTGPARELLGQVQLLLIQGASFGVGGVKSEGRDAIVLVVYSSPRFGVVGVEFFLHKSRSRWLVDADRTLGGLAAGARS
jgi:hypothetical protein